MSAIELLAAAEARGIHLFADGDEIKYRGPRGAMTPELRELLRAHRGEVFKILTDVEVTFFEVVEPEPDPAASAPALASPTLPIARDYGKAPTPVPPASIALMHDRRLALRAWGASHRWPRLPYKQAHAIAAGEACWLAFTSSAGGADILAAHAALHAALLASGAGLESASRGA